MRARFALLSPVILSLFLVCFTVAAAANSCFPCITVDENGLGTVDLSNGGGGVMIMPSGLVSDPGPGGLLSALTYDLMNPPGLVLGDVVLHESSGAPSDVIRFNPSDFAGYPFALVFYSDGSNGFDSVADTLTPPSDFYSNLVHITEIGDGTNNGAFYTPGPFDPGFIPGFDVQYTFISEGTGPAPVVPEPGTLSVLWAGLLGTWARGRITRMRQVR